MTTVANIIDDDLETQLVDPDHVIWPLATLYKYIAEAQNAIILLGADANIVSEDFTLAQTAKQTIPTGGIRFVDVDQNASGAPVRQIEKKVMDEVIYGWMTETTETAIEHFMFEEEKPTIFWVYPSPSVSTLQITLSYADSVSLITAVSDNLVLSDIYVPTIKEYVLWRCKSTEGKASQLGAATQHLQNFYTLQGKKFQGSQMLKAVQNG